MTEKQEAKVTGNSNLVSRILSSFGTEEKGRIVLACWIGVGCFATVYGSYIRSKQRKEWKKWQESEKLEQFTPGNDMKCESNDENDFEESKEIETTQTADEKSGFESLMQVWHLSTPRIVSMPVLWTSLLFGCLVFKTKRVSLVNDSIGIMGEHVVKREWNQLSKETINFTISTFYAAIAASAVNFTTKSLFISLRHCLIENILSKYRISKSDSNVSNINDGHAMYQVFRKMGDCDIRMTRDIEEWCDLFSQSICNLMIPLIDVTLYSNKLCHRIGMKYFSQCILYFFISSMWTRSVLPSMSLISKEIMYNESNFATNHNRMVDYVEEIDFLQAVSTEFELLNQSYNKLYHTLNKMNYYELIYNFFNNYVVKHIGVLAIFLSILPQCEIDDKPTQFVLNSVHDLVNIGIAIRNLLQCSKNFDKLIGKSDRISKLDDLLKMYNSDETLFKNIRKSNDDTIFYDEINESNMDNMDNMDNRDNRDNRDDESSVRKHCVFSSVMKHKAISFENVSISTPDSGRILIKNLNFDIILGQNIVITGPNGCGKSSLIRVLSGLWKIDEGKVMISPLLRQKHAMFFLPQRPYLVPKLSIRQQLMYPNIFEIDNNINDELMIELLNEFGLGTLCCVNDINKNVSNTFWLQLSPGEKQLIGLCRVLICKPKLAFIDESCSAVSKHIKCLFYEKCSQYDITLVSITHDHSLTKYHEKQLKILGNGGQYQLM